MVSSKEHIVEQSASDSGKGRVTAADSSSSEQESDEAGPDDFFASSPESEPEAGPSLKHKQRPEPAHDSEAKPETDDEEDKYDYSSESAAESEKQSETSSESETSGRSSSGSKSDGDEEEEEEEEESSSEASSISAVPSGVKTSIKKPQTQDEKKLRNGPDVSILDLYPKSLSLVGLSNRKDELKQEMTPSRPKSSASVRPCLKTRVLRKSESLEEFTASLPERLNRNGCHMQTSELTLLNQAVYEAWYFHKEELKAKLKKEEEEQKLLAQRMKPRKLFQKTIPRTTKRIKMSDPVKMKIDPDDREWEWLKKKLIKMKKAKRKSMVKAKQEEESREKKTASKLEDAALAFAAWKTKKDELARESRHREKELAKEKAEAEEGKAEENRIVADKVFEQYQQRVAAEEQEAARRRQQRQRRQADRTAQLLEARDREAQARYHQWLHGAAERAAQPPDSAGRHSPPPPRPPWYPGGTLGGGRAAPSAALPRVERPATRPAGGRGWRPCHQKHCPACPCAPPAAAVASTSRPDAQLEVDQPVTCASRRAVYVIECCFCGLQYVGWTLHSVRAAFARHLRALQAEQGTALAGHVTEHRQQSEQFVPLADCLRLVGVRSFPETVSRYAVADFAHAVKDILATVHPDGINHR